MTREEAKGNLIHAIRWNDMPKKEALDIAIKALGQEPCEDCISRKAVRDAIFAECSSIKLDIDFAKVLLLQRTIKDLPSVVSPQEPKTGHWMPLEYDGYADGYPVYDVWECSECGWEHNGDSDTLTAFCPNCGAKMEVSE